jgi:hypothetical protein
MCVCKPPHPLPSRGHPCRATRTHRARACFAPHCSDVAVWVGVGVGALRPHLGCGLAAGVAMGVGEFNRTCHQSDSMFPRVQPHTPLPLPPRRLPRSPLVSSPCLEVLRTQLMPPRPACLPSPSRRWTTPARVSWSWCALCYPQRSWPRPRYMHHRTAPHHTTGLRLTRCMLHLTHVPLLMHGVDGGPGPLPRPLSVGSPVPLGWRRRR